MDLRRGMQKPEPFHKSGILLKAAGSWNLASGREEKYRRSGMYIADLHIHSRFSRATSKEGDPQHLELWAARKGIRMVGTGDFTHPAWRQELEEKLEPAGGGLYRLKEEYRLQEWRAAGEEEPLFVVSGEISSIYKKNGRVRKVHNVILLPGLEEAGRLSARLEAIGNIHSDGRPILGLDCRDLLEILLDTCPEGILIPAHIWTPHFSMLGAFSGFDTIEECFEDLTPYIHAVETGLSSDPPMNWRLSMLDGYQLVSNSDAHSPAKLGREANLMDGELSYKGLYQAVQTGAGLAGTVEFFPEEGKYHMDGHRKCHLCLTPAQTREFQEKCPVCGRKITIGVSRRVEELADRPEGYEKAGAKPYESLVPLPEVIASSAGFSVSSVKTARKYQEMLEKLGPEFKILREVPLEDIRRTSGLRIAQGIERLRNGQVEKIPGYDGEYGVIRVFDPQEIRETEGQMDLFSCLGIEMPGRELTEEEKLKGKIREARREKQQGAFREPAAEPEQNSGFLDEGRREPVCVPEEPEDGKRESESRKTYGACGERETVLSRELLGDLNREQRRAACLTAPVTAVVVGPGTGKTKTLISRILWMLKGREIPGDQITAVTFTRKAAAEMEERLRKEEPSARVQVGTFHHICCDILKSEGREFALADEIRTGQMAELARKEFGLKVSSGSFLREVSLRKAGHPGHEAGIVPEAFSWFDSLMKEQGLLDFDDLLLEVLKRLESGEHPVWGDRFRYLLVDEFQDISPVQYRLVRAWRELGRELFVIGDPDQSIYGFRGSDSRCFEVLKKDFPETEVIRLEENYRSTRQILQSADQVISRNAGQPRTLHAARGEGVPLRLVKASGEMGEAVFTAHEINRLIGGIDMVDVQESRGNREGERVRSFSDIAVLYRTHRQARLLEACLKKEGIPYTVAGREDYLRDPLVRGTLGFFRSLRYPEDQEAKEAAMELLWGLEADEMGELVYRRQADRYRPMMNGVLPGKLMETWLEEMISGEASGDRKAGSKGNAAGKYRGLEKLKDMAYCFTTAEEWLDTVTFGEEGDIRRTGEKNGSAGTVTLMTLHGSKGLEFPVVILYGVKKGMLPLESGREPADVEEERRLFFVGMTRAREELIITTSEEPSPFLGELCQEFLVRESAGRKPERADSRDAGVQMSLFDFLPDSGR